MSLNPHVTLRSHGIAQVLGQQPALVAEEVALLSLLFVIGSASASELPVPSSRSLGSPAVGSGSVSLGLISVEWLPRLARCSSTLAAWQPLPLE